MQNKTIWITGASSGIGRGLALALSQQNAKLILSSRRQDALETVKQECAHPENVNILPLDLEQYDNMNSVVDNAISFFGKVDILINNGGISQRSLISDTDITVDKRLMDVDYLGTVALSKALLPHFIERQAGHFVTVTSLMGKFASPYRSGYCGAKHALHSFFDALRMEHENDNIKVTLVCPGFINTHIARNALTGDGSLLQTQDAKTQIGMPVEVFSQKMLRAIKKEKFEVYNWRKGTFWSVLKTVFSEAVTPGSQKK